MQNLKELTIEERLKRAELALERSDKLAIASLYAGATMHEVNNPLEAITNLVYLTKLQRHSPDQVTENMTVVELQLEALGRITKQALAFYRQQPEAQDFDLVEIVESALRLHADKLRRHGVTVARQFRRRTVTKVFGNEILQVLSNLILNAVDALPPQNGRLTVRVSGAGEKAHITVSDNGSGIPDHIALHMFEPYVTSKESGTGIGLCLSYRIIRKHNGNLRFRTSGRDNRSGTSFRISLPVKEELASVEQKTSA